MTTPDSRTPDTAPARRIRRISERQVDDRAALDALLDGEIVGHLAFAVEGAPIVVPMGYAGRPAAGSPCAPPPRAPRSHSR